MTIKPLRNPYGYRNLLIYQKADALQRECARLTSHFPPLKIFYSLADQMNRSARSVKQNIVEGWKRNSTKEYYEFLGFAIGSNTELEEDATDIAKGMYSGLMGIKGVMGEWGDEKGRMGERGERGLVDLEKIPFYPLDPNLPLVVQLKLRSKELNFLLEKLQKSLVEKMQVERTLPAAEMMRIADRKDEEGELWLRREREKLEREKGAKGG